jgi:hypothetical protein
MCTPIHTLNCNTDNIVAGTNIVENLCEGILFATQKIHNKNTSNMVTLTKIRFLKTCPLCSSLRTPGGTCRPGSPRSGRAWLSRVARFFCEKPLQFSANRETIQKVHVLQQPRSKFLHVDPCTKIRRQNWALHITPEARLQTPPPTTLPST